MKKFFSAILLMTMMVFSVGTFVSCNDLVNEIEGVKGQATELEAAVDALEAEIATLETKLQAAQSAADDAMAAAKAAQKTGDEAKVLAEAAKAAAADAEAKAIAKAKEEVAALKTELEAAIEKKADKTYVDELVKAANDAITKLQGDVKTLEDKLFTYEETLKTFKENLEKLGALTEELKQAIAFNVEAITNLKGQLDNHEMKIEDLEAAVAKIEKAMKEMDNNLIKAIAGQIQSIVYVPETTAGTIVAKGFDYSQSLTGTPTDAQKAAAKPIVFSATYEVMPKELASTITVDNASLVTVATKAAAAVECTVVSVVADDATGRVVVNARIAGGSDAYKSLIGTGGAAVALRVSQANPVEVDENTTEDLGTYVSSAYTNVTLANKGSFVNVYDKFVFVDKDNKLVGKEFDNSVTNEDKDNDGKLDPAPGYQVAYNYVGLDKANVDLFPFEVAFEMLSAAETGDKAKYVTPAEATALIGTNLAVTYVDKDANGKVVVAPKHYLKGGADFPAKDAQNNAIVTPILVTGTDLSATATLQESNKDDYKGVKSIGIYADLTLGEFKANGQPLGLTAKARYTIVEGTAVNNSVVIDEVNHTWTYGQAKTATLDPVAELAVALPDALTDVQPLFYGADGKTKEAKTFSVTWGPNNAKKTANATVEALSKKAVSITGWSGNDLDFGTDTKTYTFTAELKEPTSKITYPVSFDVNLSAMPAAKEINIPAFELYTNSTMVKDVVVLDAIIKHIAEKDSKFDWKALEALDDKDTEVVEYYTNDCEKPKVSTIDGKNTDAINLVLKTGRDQSGKNIVEKSQITIDYSKVGYGNVLKLTDEYEICGVKFTVNAEVTTKKPEFTFTVNNATAPAKVATVGGEFTLTTDKAGNLNASTKYALDQIDLRNLVVVNYGTLNPADYALRYKLLTEGPVNPATGKPDNKPITDFCAPYSSLANPTLTEAVNPLTWAYDWTTLKFEIALVSARTAYAFDEEGNITGPDMKKDEIDYDDDEEFGEPITVEIKVADLVEFEAVKPVKVQYSKTAPTKANLVGALAVTDVATQTKLYNPYATSLDAIWAGYYETATNGGTLDYSVDERLQSVLQVYDQTVTAEADDKIEVYFNGELVADPHQVVPYTYDPVKGEITLTATNIERGEFKFVVDVTLNHKYNDYGAHGHAVKAEVIFTSEAVEEDNAGDTDYTPLADKTQWIYEDEFGYRNVLDLGVHMKNTLIIATSWDDSMLADAKYDATTKKYYDEDGEEVVYAALVNGNLEFLPAGDNAGKWSYENQAFENYEIKATSPTSGIISFQVPVMEMDPMSWASVPTGEYTTSYIFYSELTEKSVKILSYGSSHETYPGLAISTAEGDPVEATLSSTAQTVFMYDNPYM